LVAGVGTPGANRDHAGEFESYIKDKNGKIIGMNDHQHNDCWGARNYPKMLK
jgi:hypothetical protein